MSPTQPGQKVTRLADISVGQGADSVFFLSRVPGGASFQHQSIERWEGQDEDGNLQKWVKGMNTWERVA